MKSLAEKHGVAAYLRFVSVVTVFTLSILIALVAYIVASVGGTHTSGRFYECAMALHSSLILYLGIIPGIAFALGGLARVHPNRGARHSTIVDWSSLLLYWAGAFCIVMSVLGSGEAGASRWFDLTRGLVNRTASRELCVGLMLVGIGTGVTGYGSLRSARESGLTPLLVARPWQSLMLVAYIVQWLILPSQALLAIMAFGRHSVAARLVPEIEDPILPVRVFWFCLQPVLLTATLPIVGYVTSALQPLSQRTDTRASVIFRAAVVYSVLSFFTWGIHLSSLGQSVRMTALFSGACLLLLIPISVPFLVWLRQLRVIPSRFRHRALPPAGVALLLAVGIASALPLVALPVCSTQELSRLALVSLYALGSATLLVVILGLREMHLG